MKLSIRKICEDSGHARQVIHQLRAAQSVGCDAPERNEKVGAPTTACTGSRSLPSLRVDGLQKSYGATVALESVSFSIASGEVHAILGENGAGKSTLVKILSGVVSQDQGAMQLAGNDYRPRSIVAAREHGVATAFQELSLLPNLTVAQNLALPRQKKNAFGIVARRRNEEATRAVLQRFRLDHVDPRSLISELSLANRQRIEIVRSLSYAPNLLILDEPTAVQTSTDWLFELIREETARGCAVLYVSHRLNEIRELCTRGTVLRGGRSIATVELAHTNDSGIFELMVGKRRIERAAVSGRVNRLSTPRISIERLSAGMLCDASFSLHKGEVLGVAGLDGQGQADLFHALFGLVKKDSGVMKVNGVETRIDSPSDAMSSGIGISLVPEERKTEGIFPYLTVQDNVMLATLGRSPSLAISRAGVQLKQMRQVSQMVDLQERYFTFKINELSGGNQQKALLARALLTGAQTLLLFDPTRGVDVGTKESIYSVIQSFADAGGSVLLYSSELSELVLLCDRCLVVYNGQIAAQLEKSDIEETKIVAAATGHYEEAGVSA